jgi:hypothetical protein
VAATAPISRVRGRRAQEDETILHQRCLGHGCDRFVRESEELVELAASLAPTTADAKDLDAITAHLGRHENIVSATWTVSTTS